VVSGKVNGCPDIYWKLNILLKCVRTGTLVSRHLHEKSSLSAILLFWVRASWKQGLSGTRICLAVRTCMRQDVFVTRVYWAIQTCRGHRLFVTCVWTRLGGCPGMHQGNPNFGTKRYSKYFPNQCTFLSWLIFFDNFIVYLLPFLINILIIFLLIWLFPFLNNILARLFWKSYE
jgi:hypothetical protein